MPIASDWTIDYINKRIYHSSGTTLYTVNECYSWLMDQFDELDQMDDFIPMSAQTPTEYTMENGWFISDDDTQWLYGGAIKTDGYTDTIRVLQFSELHYTDCVAGDLTKAVVGGTTTDSGVLLAYNNTTRKWFVRMDDSGDLFDEAETITITAGTGTGDTIGASVTGEDLYPNIYTLGTIADDPEALIYIFQNEERIAEWWDRSTFDAFGEPEHIDVLVKVKEADTEIAGGVITVFNRQYGDSFDHFEIDLTAGGRNAVPLATATDLNNTTGELYCEPTESDLSDLTVGNFIRGTTSDAVGEIMEVDDTNDYIYMGNVIGTFQTSETLQETTDGTSGGDTAFSYTNDGSTAYTNVVAGYGGAGKILIYHVSGRIDFNTGGTGTDPALYETVTGATNGATSILLQLNVTSGTFAGGDAAGWVIVGNSTGCYEGTDGTAETINFSGGRSAVITSTDGCDPTYVTAERAYSLQTGYNYSAIIDLNGDTVADFYEYLKYLNREGQEFLLYPYASKIRMLEFESSGYTDCVESDIGLGVTGGTTGDTGTLLDYDNVNRVWTVLMDACTGTPASDDLFDDRETVSVDSPGTGTGTTIGASYAGAQDGQEYLRSLPQYALSKASPYGTFAGGVFFGAQGVWIEDMATADAESYILIDHGGTTRTPPSQIEVKITSVESGDRCFVARTTGDNYIVDKGVFNIQVGAGASATEVRVEETIPNDTPTTGQLRIVRRNASGVIEGEDRVAYTSWDNDNQPTYSSFWTAATPNAIDTDDTAYVPFIDEQASSDEVSVLVQYTSNRTVVARVRYYNGAGDSIIPFQTKGPLNTGGYSTAAIRTPDSIVT